MDEVHPVFLVVSGISIGYFSHIWFEPNYIANVKSHDDGYSYVLEKAGSGQVAAIHGFVDDLAVCIMLKERLEKEGGVYGCTAHTNVKKID